MRIIFCIKGNFKKTFICNKMMVLSRSCAKCDNNNDKIFEEESNKTLRTIGLIDNVHD